VLDVVERGGNRLPDPVTRFLILIALVMAASLGAALLNIITPLLPCFPPVIVFTVGSTLTMLVWLLADLPLGPGISATMPVPE